MKFYFLTVAVVLLTPSCFAARYEFETLYQGGDLVFGSPVYMDFTDGTPPRINRRGDLAFVAGSNLVVRNADGSERIVVRQGEEIDGVNIRFQSFTIDEQGIVSHAECDDINYLARERSILSVGDYRVGGRYVRSCGISYYQLENGETVINGSIDGEYGLFTRDRIVLARGDIVAGIESREVRLLISPDGQRSAMQIYYGPSDDDDDYDPLMRGSVIAVDNQILAGTGLPINGFVNVGSLLFGVNDFGEAVYSAGDAANVETQGIYLNEELIVSRSIDWHGQSMYNLGIPTITNDGNAVVRFRLTSTDGSSPSNGISFNDQLILHNDAELPGLGTLTRLGLSSSNARGDIVFNGKFDDGVNRIVLARRLDPEHGDFNDNGQFDVTDINRLDAAIAKGVPDERYDMANDGQLDLADRQYWIFQIANSTYGDSNLDGTFNSQDLVITFQAGEYEDSLVGNSNWSDG
ncbi:MAG: hypothetical protein KDA87_26495, partial [Planctomycetales bacterium]|nr:hypothetical protein [Planctomycetales bacterium]